MRSLFSFWFFILLASIHASAIKADSIKKPLVSIITSLYNGDEFINHFLIDITRQTIFDQCELIIINANSPGNEEPIIIQFMEQYPNIIYKKLSYDPGLYAVWNIAIKMARSEFISNANIDDRMAPNFLEVHSKALQNNPQIDLVYSDSYWSTTPNMTFEQNNSSYLYPCGKPSPEFSKKAMSICLPACHPVWRKSLHDRYGFFDEKFKALGDHEMWLRVVQRGSVFKKVPGVFGVYYTNPNGLSTAGYTMVQGTHQIDPNANANTLKKRERLRKERKIIKHRYPAFFK